MKYIGIVFDLDGTLIDSLGDLCSVINATRQARGLKVLTEAEVSPHVGWGVKNLITGCFPGLKDEEEVESLITEFRSCLETLSRDPIHAYPGVDGALQFLRQSGKVKLAVATNKHSRSAEMNLQQILPEHKFEAVMGPDRVSQFKPHPAHLLETLKAIEVEPANAWFIGDHIVDRECARNAGVRFLGAVYGFGRVEVAEEERLYQFSDLLKKVVLD